jgi:hypothetical protein
LTRPSLSARLVALCLGLVNAFVCILLVAIFVCDKSKWVPAHTIQALEYPRQIEAQVFPYPIGSQVVGMGIDPASFYP